MTSLISSQIQFLLPFQTPTVSTHYLVKLSGKWSIVNALPYIYNVYFKAHPGLSGFLSALGFWDNIFFHCINTVRHVVGCLSSSWWQSSETGISDPVFSGIPDWTSLTDPSWTITWEFYNRTEGLQFSSLHRAGLETCTFGADRQPVHEERETGSTEKEVY